MENSLRYKQLLLQYILFQFFLDCLQDLIKLLIPITFINILTKYVIHVKMLLSSFFLSVWILQNISHNHTYGFKKRNNLRFTFFSSFSCSTGD